VELQYGFLKNSPFHFFKKPGFVETLEKQSIVLGGSFLHRASAPAASGIPHIAIIPDNVENNLRKKRGSRGCSPHAASPSGGERGSPSWLPQRITE
jgi:hypothetical protein